MKKVLVFAMILCTLLLALTGCSKEAEPVATEAPAATEAATEAPAEEPAAEEEVAEEEPAAEEPAAEETAADAEEPAAEEPAAEEPAADATTAEYRPAYDTPRSHTRAGCVLFWRGGEGGAFGPGGNDGSHRLDTVATPACVGALPSNGRSLARERPRLHEGGVCLGGTGRAARLSCPGEPSCRKFSSGLAAGGGCRNVVGNGALGGASACAPGSGACRQ